jgi:hypothetical protein
MKTIHANDAQGRPACVVQIRQYNQRSCTAAARYMAELEADGYKLSNQHGGDVVWNFIYTKINRGKEDEQDSI